MVLSCSRWYTWIIPKIEYQFSRYGRFVSRHPWKVIITSVAVNLLLCIGLIRFHLLIDLEKIYTPENSRSFQDREKLKSLFPDTSGILFRSYQTPTIGRWGDVIVTPLTGNAIDIEFLTELRQLVGYVTAIVAHDGHGSAFTWTDICARTFNSCSIEGDLFVDNEFISSISTNTAAYPFFYHSLKGPIFYEHLVVGAQTEFGVLKSAHSLWLRFNIRTDEQHFDDLADKWQAKFLDAMEVYTNDKFHFAYSHQDSLNEEVNDNLLGDLTFIALAFFFIGAYACLAMFTATTNCVTQRALLGLPGVLAAGLAAGSSLGLLTACGMEVVSIVGAVPFLIMGIGVDDMFMLMAGLANAKFDASVEDRVGETMRTSGISITITSLTDILAFAAGASSIFMGVRNFCAFAGTAVLICYINQCTIFLGCVVLHENRVKENRHIITGKHILSRQENAAKGRSKAYVMCCSGSHLKGQHEAESFLDKLPKWLIPRLVTPKPMKVLIILILLAYLAIAIWGVVNLDEGIDFITTVKESSYHYKYREYFDSKLQWLTPISLVFDQERNYTDGDVQQKIQDLVFQLKSDSRVKDYYEVNWLSVYKNYPGYDNSSSLAFVRSLRSFLGTRSGSLFANDVVIDDSRNAIVASRIHLLSEDISDSQDQAKFMADMREIVDANEMNLFVFSNLFIFYEQYLVVLSQTIQTVGVAVAMVFLVTFFFMPHPLMMCYMTTTIIFITIGIFGFLYLLGLTLNSVTMVQVIMSIGFSVDFVAHICHGFLLSEKKSRQDRVNDAVRLSGPPIFHGAMSTFLGMCALAFAKSFLYFSFFQVMSLVILFGITHALIFLPVILSLFGPTVRLPDKNEAHQGTSTGKTEQNGVGKLHEGSNNLPNGHRVQSISTGVFSNEFHTLVAEVCQRVPIISLEEWKRKVSESKNGR